MAVNCPQVVPPSPLIGAMRCLDLQLANFQMDVNWDEGSLWCTLYKVSIRGWGHKFRLEILFFFFACHFISQFTSFTEHYKVNFTHGPKFPHRHLIKPSLKVKQNFSCSFREGGSTEEVFALTTREGVSSLHSSLGLHWCHWSQTQKKHNKTLGAGLNLWNAERVWSQLTAVSIEGMLKEAMCPYGIKPQPYNSFANYMTKGQ